MSKYRVDVRPIELPLADNIGDDEFHSDDVESDPKFAGIFIAIIISIVVCAAMGWIKS
ncbi:MAG: hypothetical protein ACYC4K_10860 [Thiobacillus sp.]